MFKSLFLESTRKKIPKEKARIEFGCATFQADILTASPKRQSKLRQDYKACTFDDEEVKRSTLTTLEAPLVEGVLDLLEGFRWEISTSVFHTVHVGLEAPANVHTVGEVPCGLQPQAWLLNKG